MTIIFSGRGKGGSGEGGKGSGALEIKNNIRDCILEAPNGVVDIERTLRLIRLKQGLKMLCATGVNSKGTYNNKEVILKNAIDTYLNWGVVSTSGIFIYNNTDNNCLFVVGDNYYERKTEPETSANNVVWYNPDTNVYMVRETAGGSWVEKECCKILNFITSNGTISDYEVRRPLLLDVKDISGSYSGGEISEAGLTIYEIEGE